MTVASASRDMRGVLDVEWGDQGDIIHTVKAAYNSRGRADVTLGGKSWLGGAKDT